MIATRQVLITDWIIYNNRSYWWVNHTVTVYGGLKFRFLAVANILGKIIHETTLIETKL